MAPLTESEIDELRALIPIAQEIRAQHEFRKSQQIVFGFYRKFVVYLAASIAAIVALRDQIAGFLGVK